MLDKLLTDTVTVGMGATVLSLGFALPWLFILEIPLLDFACWQIYMGVDAGSIFYDL